MEAAVLMAQFGLYVQQLALRPFAHLYYVPTHRARR